MKEIKKLIEDYPATFLFTAFALFIPNGLAILILKYNTILTMGIQAIVFFSILLAIIPLGIWFINAKIFTWWIARKREVENNQIVYDVESETVLFSLTVSSLVCGLINTLILTICYLFSLSFKTYYSIVILFPVFRFIMLFVEAAYFKKRSINKFLPKA